MAAGRAQALRAGDPRLRKVRIVGANGKSRAWQDVWNGHPDIAAPGEVGEFLTLIDGPNARPYIAQKTDWRWTWKPYQPVPALICFTKAEKEFGARHAGRVIIEPNVKAVDGRQNKQWPWSRWSTFASRARAAGVRLTQLGPADTPVLDAVEHIVTTGFRDACAVMARSLAYCGHEGGLHHAAAAAGIPAVVIFGAFVSPRVTGYAQHRNIFTGNGLGCGMRVPCACCTKAMAAITPERVLDELREILQ